MLYFYFHTGIAVFIVVFTMRIPQFELTKTADILTWLFMIFPHFSLSDSLNSLNIGATTARFCRSKCNLIAGCSEKLMCAMFRECCGWFS